LTAPPRLAEALGRDHGFRPSVIVPTVAAGLLGCAILGAGVGTAELRIGCILASLGAAGYLADRAAAGGAAGDVLDVMVRSACLALVIALVLTGIVLLVPGAVDARWIIGALAGIILALGVTARCKPGVSWTLSRETLAHTLFILALGGPVRLVLLGYSELQGDEARVMNRAAALFMGENAAVTVHHKGPGELMLATFWGALLGRATEADARFPFALASVLGVLALYAVGRLLFSPTAGLVAGALWAINGYAIAVGRVVQYHSLVVLLTSAALLCAAAAAADRARARAHAPLALIFLVTAAICGFNVPILALPAILLLLTLAAPRFRNAMGGLLARGALVVLAIAVLGAGVMAVTSPQVLRELGTYALERVGRGQPFNNLDLLTGVTMQYASLPYLLLSLAGGSLAVGWAVLQARTRRRARLAAVATVMAGEIVLAYTHGQPTGLAILVWAGLVALSVAVPAQFGPVWRTLMLSVMLPMGAYLFVILRPGMHWYEIFPALVLLVGGWSARLRTPPRPVAWLAPALGTSLLLFILAYPAMMFVRGWPESSSMPLAEVYRPAIGEPRRGGHLGYPRQEGWKAVAALYQEGWLPGPLQTNQWSDVARWYVPEAEWCSRAPRYVLAPSATQPRRNPEGSLLWVIRNDGPRAMIVLERGMERRAFREVDARDYAAWFDEHRASLRRPLTVEPRDCPRMPPSWDPNDAAAD
jgi:dolichyl-phosphate-mannose-protein mannosyltransferase